MLQPTLEIIRKAQQLRSEFEFLMDMDSDPQEINNVVDAYRELKEKYGFHDAPFEEHGKVGLKDLTGNIRVPALYRGFFETYIYFDNRDVPVPAINEEGKIALVLADGSGTPITPFVYDHIRWRPENGHFLCAIGKQCGLLDRDGQLIVPCEYHWVEYSDGPVTPLERDEKYGFLIEGRDHLLVPCEYDEYESHRDHLFARKEDQWGYFDFEGHFLPTDNVDTQDLSHCIVFYEYTPIFTLDSQWRE